MLDPIAIGRESEPFTPALVAPLAPEMADNGCDSLCAEMERLNFTLAALLQTQNVLEDQLLQARLQDVQTETVSRLSGLGKHSRAKCEEQEFDSGFARMELGADDARRKKRTASGGSVPANNSLSSIGSASFSEVGDDEAVYRSGSFATPPPAEEAAGAAAAFDSEFDDADLNDDELTYRSCNAGAFDPIDEDDLAAATDAAYLSQDLAALRKSVSALCALAAPDALSKHGDAAARAVEAELDRLSVALRAFSV